MLEDFIADDDRAAALRWEEAERLRDPDHVRLLNAGRGAGAALAAGLTVEAEESWFETFEVDSWLELAETGGDAAGAGAGARSARPRCRSARDVRGFAGRWGLRQPS